MRSFQYAYHAVLVAIAIFFTALQVGPAELSPTTWTSHSPSSIPRTEAACAVYDGKLYVVGGFAQDVVGTHVSEMYDPETDTWSSLAPIPRAVTHVGAALVDGRIWVVGGFEGDHPGPAVEIVQIYDITADTWVDGPALPSPRASGTLALLGRNLHYVGGLLPDRKTDLGEHVVLNVDRPEDGWATAAPLPEARNHLSSVVFEGKLYAIGGQFGHDGGRTLTPRVHVYDFATDTWSRRANLPLRRSHAEASTFVYNGSIIMAGGVGPGSNRTASLDLVTAYDPTLDTWSELEPLPEKLLGPEVRVIDSRLVVANGSIGLSGNAQSTVWSMPIEPLGPDTLGFWPQSADLRLRKGESQSIRLMLWTHHGDTDYAVSSEAVASWLTTSHTDSRHAGASGSELDLTVDASHLQPGTYQTSIVAAAPEYPSASFTVTLEVISDPLSSASEPPESIPWPTLEANFPNPFDDVTTIPYTLDRHGYATLSVYNLLGERVAVLFNGLASEGTHEVTFNAGDLPNGAYLYELRAGQIRKIRWMSRVR